MSRSQLMFLWAVVLTSSASVFGDWTYNPGTGHWYRLTTDFGTWVQANDEATAAGGYLATICSQEENDWVTQLATIAAGATERFGGGNNAWIGYRDAGSGWCWENGEPCDCYTNLHPNWNSFTGNHAYIHGADHPSPGTWQHNQLHDNANDPDHNVRGIIEHEVGDWTYNPSTKHWYRLTNNFGTWAEANAEAIKSGGYLVTICSQEENDWVTQLATIAAGATERSGEGNNAWIGYRDAGSGWGWENGETCGYTNLHSNWNSFSLNHAYILGADHGEPGFWGRNQLHDNDFIRNVRGIIEREVDPAVPTISEWGIVVMTLLTLAAGTIILVRPRLTRK